MDDTFGPVISAYSRADAIGDGVLIDVSEMAREAGIKIECALTSAAWAKCVAWSAADNERKGTLQDEPGRLWDVLHMFVVAVRHNRSAPYVGSSSILYSLYVVPRDGLHGTPRPRCLSAACGPGDDGTPVLTIMLPDES